MALLNEREAFLHFFRIGAEELVRVVAHGSPNVMHGDGEKQVDYMTIALALAARRLAKEMFVAAPSVAQSHDRVRE